MSTTSQHLTVGGLVTFDYRLASVPDTINVISLSATLVSTLNVRSMKNPNVALAHSFRRTTLYDINARAPLHKNTDLHILTFDEEREAIPFVPPGKSHAVGSPLQVVPSGGSFHVRFAALLTTFIQLSNNLAHCCSSRTSSASLLIMSFDLLLYLEQGPLFEYTMNSS